MEQIRKQKPQPQAKTAEQATIETHTAEADQELEAKTAELLDEIDSILEENAETFVKEYVQKGGE